MIPRFRGDKPFPKPVSTFRDHALEIGSIDELFYLTEKDGDPAQHAGMLERKRDDMIRAAVLQLHGIMAQTPQAFAEYHV
jgi:hypothetical protein